MSSGDAHVIVFPPTCSSGGGSHNKCVIINIDESHKLSLPSILGANVHKDKKSQFSDLSGDTLFDKDGLHFSNHLYEAVTTIQRSSRSKELKSLRINGLLHTLISKASSLAHDWSPLLLVFSYFVTSTFAYMLCPYRLIEIFWFIYNVTNFAIAATTALEAFRSVSTVRLAREALKKTEDRGWQFPTPDKDLPILDLVIVAYLPNEKDIIMDRIYYMLEEIVYPKDKIWINVVYNSPMAIKPLETQMWQLSRNYSQLRVIKVENSTSKAENLNYFLSLDTGSELTAIFDCDHYPHPHNPRWAAERFIAGGLHNEKCKVDIVQGRCVVFNSKASFLTGMIAVEFDKIYAVSHPGRAAIWGFGLFCGSNGYWRTTVIRDLKMDGKMLTEDIDATLRACGRGLKAEHELNCISYELAPVTWHAFWKQRSRWAQGWFQATLKHTILTFSKASHGERVVSTRFGLLNLLLIRELSYYLTTQFTCLVLSVIFLNFPRTPAAFWEMIFFQYPVSEWIFFFSIFCLGSTLAITNSVHSEFASRWMVLKFILLYPLYLLLLAVIGIYAHARQAVRYSSWNPTARE